MKEGCVAFIVGWEDELIKALLERETNIEVEERLCFNVSKACVNVDMSDAPVMPDEIEVDG